MKVTKFFIVFLVALLLCHSCKVYQIHNVTLEEAIASKENVKVIMWDKKYTFCKLMYKEEQLYGIDKITSTTAKKLDHLMAGCSLDGKIAKFKLDENDIQEIYLRNKK